MKDCRKLDLEDLSLDDYRVLICALNAAELYLLEIQESYYDELSSKLNRNYEKLEYNLSIE